MAKPAPERSEPRDLGELELDGSFSSEDVDEHLDLELVLVDLHDLAGEVGKRTFLDTHRFAHLVLETSLGMRRGLCLDAFFLYMQEGLDLSAKQW